MSLKRVLERMVQVRDDEVGSLLWATAYFFFLFASYFILRPVRDTAAVAGGVRNLPWLFTATLVAMLAVHPIHAAVVSRLPRRAFVPLVYGFFALNLVAFAAAMALLPAGHQVWVGRVFYVWTSVFNLFVVSVFWSYMADVFTPEQGARLFGCIAVGGTLGGVAGSALTASLAGVLTPSHLLPISTLLLLVAIAAATRLAPAAHAVETDAAVGGSAVDGFRAVARSPYLLGICGYMLLYTVTSTFLYFQQAELVAVHLADRATRTTYFASVDLAVNLITAVVQIFATGRILRVLGVAAGLAVLPALSLVGFAALGLAPTLAMLAAFQVLRRTSNYAVSRPSREVLYTVVSRQDKYKAKHLLDTFVYRAGDQLGAWTTGALAWIGAGIMSAGVLAIPLTAVWTALAVWLGRRQRALAGSGVSPAILPPR